MRQLTRSFLGALLAATALVLAACGNGGADGEGNASDREFSTRTVESGAVTVSITPIQVDARGAAFTIALDTHSIELDLDVAGHTRLVVGGTPWTKASWDGAGPGGHHREGTLRFEAAGDPAGSITISMGGLPEPVKATWTLKGG